MSDDIVRLSLECTTTKDPGVVLADTITVDDGVTCDVPYNNTAVYSPLAYLPILMGFSLGSFIGFSAETQYYMAEAFALVFYTVICTAAIMGLPRHRLAMLLLVLWVPSYNPSGNPGVLGIQYRYFLPYLPFALLMVLDCVTDVRLSFAKSRIEYH